MTEEQEMTEGQEQQDLGPHPARLTTSLMDTQQEHVKPHLMPGSSKPAIKNKVPHYNSFLSLTFRAASRGSTALMKFSILAGFEFTCFFSVSELEEDYE